MKPDGAKFISEAMHRDEDYEATFEGEINGRISVGLREADLDKRNRYRSKVYEPLAEAALSQGDQVDAIATAIGEVTTMGFPATGTNNPQLEKETEMNAARAALQEGKVKATQSGFSKEYSRRRRTLAEIQQAEQEIFDKRWYDRHVSSGRPKVGRKPAKRIEKKYGKKNLGPYTDFEWGVLAGRHYALRWVLGFEWECGDT